MKNQVIINDVGPRDGLQNQAKILSPDDRLTLVRSLIDAGINAIEVGSFVSPKAVPAMAGTDELIALLPYNKVCYSVLIPNQKGYELALAAGIKVVEVVVASTNTMNEKNICQSTEQAMAGVRDIAIQAKKEGVKVLACIATAWECPFEGKVDEGVVIGLAQQLFEFGVSEVVLADTIGAASPAAVKSLMIELVAEFGAEKLSCHFHDTRGMGVANVFAATEAGIRKFDSSIGGLGGCPFAPGATGNVATEDVALLLQQMGFETGINLGKLVDAVELAADLTGNCDGGHSFKWLKRQREKGAI